MWDVLSIACYQELQCLHNQSLVLARNDLDVNNRDQYEKSPLHFAVGTRKVKVVRAILERKDLDVDFKHFDSDIPLLHAFEQNDVDMIKAILERMDVDVNVKD